MALASAVIGLFIMGTFFYGFTAFGYIQGLFVAIMTPTGFIGVAVTGWIFDAKGSYQLAWLGFALANAVAMLLVLVLAAHAHAQEE